MTPYELALKARAFNDRAEAERNENIAIAYLGAALQRAKRMPRLESLLTKEETKRSKEQTPEEMLAMALRLNAGNKGQVVREGV